MTEAAQKKSWSRGRTALFYVSVAMNVLIVGVIVGALFVGGRPMPRAGFDGPFPMLRALSEEERGAFVRIVRQSRDSRPERPVKSLRRSRELLSLLSAEEFDAAKFDALLSDQSRAAAGRADTARVALTVLLSDMSVAQRQAYAARLEASLQRTARDRRKPDAGHGPSR
ncbi:MAG: periplasmic heavy metal sensor [Pseudomonadota bacterium]